MGLTSGDLGNSKGFTSSFGEVRHAAALPLCPHSVHLLHLNHSVSLNSWRSNIFLSRYLAMSHTSANTYLLGHPECLLKWQACFGLWDPCPAKSTMLGFTVALCSSITTVIPGVQPYQIPNRWLLLAGHSFSAALLQKIGKKSLSFWLFELPKSYWISSKDKERIFNEWVAVIVLFFSWGMS